MSTTMNELTKEVVNKELLIFKRFQVDVKDIKCPLEWWVKHEFYFQFYHFLFIRFLVFKKKLKEFFHWLEFLQI